MRTLIEQRFPKLFQLCEHRRNFSKVPFSKNQTRKTPYKVLLYYRSILLFSTFYKTIYTIVFYIYSHQKEKLSFPTSLPRHFIHINKVILFISSMPPLCANNFVGLFSYPAVAGSKTPTSKFSES